MLNLELVRLKSPFESPLTKSGYSDIVMLQGDNFHSLYYRIAENISAAFQTNHRGTNLWQE